MAQTLYAQFDGDEIDGTVYPLGAKIDDKVDAGTRLFLMERGRIAATKPPAVIVLPVDDGKPVEDMTRAELESSAMAAIAARMADASDDQLREAIEGGRDAVRAKAAEQQAGTPQAPVDSERGDGGDDNRVGTTPYDELKDKPLKGMKTADLVTVAEHENVSIVDAKNNDDRANLIEAARKAKAEG